MPLSGPEKVNVVLEAVSTALSAFRANGAEISWLPLITWIMGVAPSNVRVLVPLIVYLPSVLSKTILLMIVS